MQDQKPPPSRPATFRVSADINRISSFFYTYEESVSGAPVIAGVRLGSVGTEITVYSRQQAQEIADALLGLVAQFAEYEAAQYPNDTCGDTHGGLTCTEAPHADPAERHPATVDGHSITWPAGGPAPLCATLRPGGYAYSCNSERGHEGDHLFVSPLSGARNSWPVTA